MRYENPNPILTVSLQSLLIETKDSHSGSFSIKNSGGGELYGHIYSRLQGLSFTPNEWSGNSLKVDYLWDASKAAVKAGESINGCFYVTSNGGEAVIPVSAKHTRMSIATPSGKVIANVKDFYEYSLASESGARRMFTDSEFYMLLLATGYPYLEVYENLHKDANRERAMDNFFILSGLKKKTEIFVKEKKLLFSSNNDETITGKFHVLKSDTGYAQTDIKTVGGASWLVLSTGRLVSHDFGETLAATASFIIEPKRIPMDFSREEIFVGQEPLTDKSNVLEVIYRRKNSVKAKLSRDTYKFDDTGLLIVTNNTGNTLTVEPFCTENYIRFGAKKFVVDEYAEIPFEVKLSAFLNAQIYFRKIAFLKAVIEIKYGLPGAIQKKSLPVVVGGF